MERYQVSCFTGRTKTWLVIDTESDNTDKVIASYESRLFGKDAERFAKQHANLLNNKIIKNKESKK